MNNTADKVIVVDGFENDLDISLQKSCLSKELCFFSQRLRCGRVWFTLRIQFETWTLKKKLIITNQVSWSKATYSDPRNHQCDVIKVGKQEGSNCGSISYMFYNGLNRFSLELVNKLTGIFSRPLNVTNMFLQPRRSPFSFTCSFGSTLKFCQTSQFCRASYSFLTDSH